MRRIQTNVGHDNRRADGAGSRRNRRANAARRGPVERRWTGAGLPFGCAADRERRSTATGYREAAAHRTEAKQLREQYAQTLAEKTSLETERDTLRAELHTIRIEGALTGALSDAGAIYPDACLKLIDASAIKLNKAGQVDGDALAAQIADLRTRYPGLFQRPTLGQDAGATGARNGAVLDMNRELRQMAGRG